MCDKIIQYSLFFFFSLFLLLHWDTKSTDFFYFARNMSCVCVCECVMVASLRFYLATDESASVATTAGATLTAISIDVALQMGGHPVAGVVELQMQT